MLWDFNSLEVYPCTLKYRCGSLQGCLSPWTPLFLAFHDDVKRGFPTCPHEGAAFASKDQEG